MSQELEFEGRVYDVDFLMHKLEEQHILEQAHAIGRPFFCLCNEARAQVYVYCRRKKLYLARHRGGGELHDPHCDKYELLSWKGRDAAHQRAVSAIHPTGERFMCNLSVPLQTSLQTDATPKVSSSRHRLRSDSQPSRATMGALLGFALEQAGLCTYDPNDPQRREYELQGKQWPWTVAAGWLQHACDNIDLSNGSLRDRLIIPRIHNQARVRSKLHSIRQVGPRRCNRYLLVIGRIEEWQRAKDGDILIRLEYCDQPFRMRKSAWEAMTRCSWSRNADQVARDIYTDSATACALMIWRIEVTSTGATRILNGAMMVTTRHWIPVQSEPEREVADALVVERAQFCKPIRSIAGLPFLPDFLRLVALGEIPMEVAGFMGDPGYAEHLAYKLTEYPNYYTLPVWVWYVNKGPRPAMPR